MRVSAHSKLLGAVLAGAMPLIAFADPVPAWLPQALRAQIAQLPTARSSDSLATVFICDPYCETVGEFYSRTEFKPTSKDFLKKAARSENLAHLKLVIAPVTITEGDPEQTHEAEEVSGQAEGLSSSGNPEKYSSPESAKGATSERVEDGDQLDTPLLIGLHFDALAGATSLSTGAAGNQNQGQQYTDTGSDAQTHGILGGGLDFEAKDVFDLGSGAVDFDGDLSYWGSVGQKSKENTGQSWSTQSYRALLGLNWAKPQSRWHLGLLLEGRQQSDNSSPDTALAFTSKYLWISAGAQIQYRKTTLRVLQSVINSSQDVDQYRGASISSSRLGVELESCKGLASILKGEFDICGLGGIGDMHVSGQGTPLQPVFVTNPTYSYFSWSAGLEFKIAGISL
jgi:hypothetical protein